jgi:hypothetical protein
MFFEEEYFEREHEKARQRAYQKAHPSFAKGTKRSSRASSKTSAQNGFKYSFHPDAEFDPSEYLIAEEIRSRKPPCKLRDEIMRYRFGLYRVYGNLCHFCVLLSNPNLML